MSSPGKGRRFLPAFYSKRQKIYDTIVFLYAIQTQYILRTLHLFVLSIKRISLQNVSNILFDGQKRLFLGSVILLIMGLHGSLGAWLASDFGVHITADQLLVRGEDLNQIFQ